MSIFKRSISLLVVLGILLGVLAPAAQAAPAGETATVDTEAMTIEGTNGFGNLLSQEITESQEEAETAEAEYPGGYTVTDLVIEGNTAKVTYDTMENATLVVALYTEDGMQMLTSTTATVIDTDDKVKNVTKHSRQRSQYYERTTGTFEAVCPEPEFHQHHRHHGGHEGYVPGCDPAGHGSGDG